LQKWLKERLFGVGQSNKSLHLTAWALVVRESSVSLNNEYCIGAGRQVNSMLYVHEVLQMLKQSTYNTGRGLTFDNRAIRKIWRNKAI
jgi:hypothetical protein